MTQITLQNGSIVVRDGKVGTEQNCCCDQQTPDCNLILCATNYRQEIDVSEQETVSPVCELLPVNTGAFAIGWDVGSACGGSANIPARAVGIYPADPDDTVTCIYDWTEYEIVENCEECEEIEPSNPQWPETAQATINGRSCVTITEGFPCDCNPLP